MTQKDIDADLSAFVDAGFLLAFMDPTAARSDVLNSMLLAQLAADKSCSRIEQPKNWYDAYGDTLGKVAWTGGGFHFNTFKPPRDRFTLNEVILHVLGQYEDPVRVRETMDAFAALPEDDPRVIVFCNFAVTEHALNVLVGVGEGSSVTAAGVCFQTQQSIERPFGAEYLVESLEGSIATVHYEGSLNEQIYSKIRQQVLDKLGNKREEFILDLLKNRVSTQGE